MKFFEQARALFLFAGIFALILFFPVRWPGDVKKSREEMIEIFFILKVGMNESEVKELIINFKNFEIFLRPKSLVIIERRRFLGDTRNWHLLVGLDDGGRVVWAGFRYAQEGNFRPCKAPKDLGESSMKTDNCF